MSRRAALSICSCRPPVPTRRRDRGSAAPRPAGPRSRPDRTGRRPGLSRRPPAGCCWRPSWSGAVADPARLRAGADRRHRLGQAVRADLPAAGRRAAAATPRRWCCRHCRLHRADRRRGGLAGRADRPAAAPALERCCSRRRWRCRRSSPATAGSRCTPRIDGCAARPDHRRWPTSRSSTCRSPRRCAGWTRRWRRRPGSLGLRRPQVLRPGGAAAAAAGHRSAARCWSGCTCWPSSARCRCCASRPSPPRSTTSTSPPSTAPRPPCWPPCWSPAACCC